MQNTTAETNQQAAARIQSGNITSEDAKKALTGEYGFVGAAKQIGVKLGIVKNKSEADSATKERKRKEGQQILDKLQKGDREAMKSYLKSKGWTVNRLSNYLYENGYEALKEPALKKLASVGKLTVNKQNINANLSAAGYGKQQSEPPIMSQFWRKTTSDVLSNAYEELPSDQKREVNRTIGTSVWQQITANPMYIIPLMVIGIGAAIWGIVSIFKPNRKRGKGGV